MDLTTGICEESDVGSIGIDVLVPGSGNFILGVTRILALTLLMIKNYRNRFCLNQYDKNSIFYAKELLLPSYFPCLYSLMITDAISAVIDIILGLWPMTENTRLHVNSWILPIESGAFHCIFEGIAFFLLSYGAGKKSFQYAIKYGILWGMITFIFFFFEFRLIIDTQPQIFLTSDPSIWYSLLIIYFAGLFLFYTCLLLLPNQILYKRPAAKIYAKFNMFLMLYWILAASCVRFYSISSVCGFSLCGLVIISLFQPIIVWRTLVLDSQYWQGLIPDKENPLATVWEQIDMGTALGMSEILTKYERDKNSKVELLHFGLITLNRTIGFVSGGFSRVYFGTLRDKQVALKIMFAMELTSEDVEGFFNEAKILKELAHENVVECKGVCVMPPAFGIVLEYCSFGSLFDFIHKRQSYDCFMKSISPSFLKNNPSIISSFLMTKSSAAINPLQRFGIVNSTKQLNAIQSVIDRDTIDETRWGLSNISEDEKTLELKATQTHMNNIDIDINKDKIISTDDTNVHLNLAIAKLGQESNRNNSNISSNDNSNRQQRLKNNANNVHISSIDVESPTSQNPSFSERDSTKPQDKRISVTFRVTNPSSWSFGFGSRHSNSSNRSSKQSLKSDQRSNRDSIGSYSAKRLHHLIRSGLSFGGKNNKNDDDPTFLAPVFRLTYTMRCKMILDVIRSIAFLHSKGYIHSDIKSLNFLVTEDFRVKLSDMGETRHLDVPPKGSNPIVPAKNWAPPEVLSVFANSRSYTMKSDIFGMSIVIAELLTLVLPFGDEPEIVTPDVWYRRLTVENVRPILGPSTNQNIRNILEQAWSTDPLKRPRADEIYEVFDANLSSYPSETL